MRPFALSLLLMLSSTASAVPLELSTQGRLHDALGNPLTSTHTVEFRIYDAPAGGVALWQEPQTLDFQDGYYGAVLGQSPSNALQDSDFDGGKRYLGIAVDGAPELPERIAIASVPYAIRANTAVNVSGGIVDASEIRIGGSTIIDSSGAMTSGEVDWSRIVNVPAEVSDPSDTLDDLALSCTSSQLPVWSGSAWACGDVPSHTHDASDLTGTIAIGRLPIGNSSSTVSAGDHVHDYSELQGSLPTHAHDFSEFSGTVPASALPSDGTFSGDISAANGAFSGVVTIGDGSSVTCSSTTQGALRYDSTNQAVEFCDGDGWVFVAGGGLGSSAGNPARDCTDIMDSGASTGNGVYWLDPDGTGGQPASQRYCEMTIAGGGWTLMAHFLDADRIATNFMDMSRSECTSGVGSCITRNFYASGEATEVLVVDNANQGRWAWTERSAGGPAAGLIELLSVNTGWGASPGSITWHWNDGDRAGYTHHTNNGWMIDTSPWSHCTNNGVSNIGAHCLACIRTDGYCTGYNVNTMVYLRR